MTIGMVLLTFGKIFLVLMAIYAVYTLWCNIMYYILSILAVIAWPVLGILGIGTTFGLSIYLAVTGQASVSAAVGSGIIAGIALFLIVGIVGGIIGGIFSIIIPNTYLPESVQTHDIPRSSDYYAGFAAGQNSK